MFSPGSVVIGVTVIVVVVVTVLLLGYVLSAIVGEWREGRRARRTRARLRQAAWRERELAAPRAWAATRATAPPRAAVPATPGLTEALHVPRTVRRGRSRPKYARPARADLQHTP